MLIYNASYIQSLPVNPNISSTITNGDTLVWDDITDTWITGSGGGSGSTGYTGYTGPTGYISAVGSLYSNYAYWNPNSSSWLAETGISIHIGGNAGLSSQQGGAVAIGYNSGEFGQGDGATAIGYASGSNQQGMSATAIGKLAGYVSQGGSAIAIGDTSGYSGQGYSAIAIGTGSAQNNQGQSAIAIGSDSGKFNQGQSAIAIGKLAGNSNQFGNSIILNASGTILNGTDSAFYVKHTRSIAAGTGTNQLTYNTSTSEIYLNTDKTFVIDHPQYKDKYLVHACLEGPESGVYYRGNGRIYSNLDDEYETEIVLPEYVKDLATDFTIQITSIGKESSLYKTSEVNEENGTFKVFGKSGKFFWHVYGKRHSIQVEPLKSTVDIKGSGPYKWI